MKRLMALVLRILLAGFLGATLLRIAPGFGVDEAELDPRLGAEAIAGLREKNRTGEHLPAFYGTFLLSLARGDLGVSRSLGQPNRELIRDRYAVTLRSLGTGLALAWIAGMAAAALVASIRSPQLDFLFSGLAGSFLCLPAAVLALLFLYLEAGPGPAIGTIIFPRVFRYTRNLLLEARARPYALAARARGVGPFRMLVWHLLRPPAPQMITLLGLTINMGITASIPIEALCDSPGIGHLAWTAALGRDMQLLVTSTLLVAAATMIANYLAEEAARIWVTEQA
jgi:ABC-type dipeptide/oligopeptide/nickel transport system permease component